MAEIKSGFCPGNSEQGGVEKPPQAPILRNKGSELSSQKKKILQ
jgi:hypothetical protein